jgi:hypothetical protein
MKRAMPIAFALMFVLHVPATKAQSALLRKDIPAIAKAANGAIVSIVMSDKDGKPIGQGSGFFVSKDGLVVTNYHVIAEGNSAVVKLPDGAFYAVDGVLSSDKARDIAIIKVHGQNFRALPLGNSDRVQVGEEVVAIGSPLSLESTVSNGIVSGIRTAEDLGGRFLQVTAPISPGSSGGPLFNMTGEVIGITTLYIKGGENLNFAIPINDAKQLLLKPAAQPAQSGNWFEQNGFTEVAAPSAYESARTTWISVGSGSAARSFYDQDYAAGVFAPEEFITAPDGSKVSVGPIENADFVCFSSDAHSDEFFTFQTWVYDKEYADTMQWLSTHFRSDGQEIWMKHFKTKVAIEEKERYLSLGTGTLADYMPSGGRLLKKDIYSKGVKIDTLEYHWDGASWFHYPYLGYLVSLGAIPRRTTDAPTSTPRARHLSIQLFSNPDSYDADTQVLQYVETDADRHAVASGFCKRVPAPKAPGRQPRQK